MPRSTSSSESPERSPIVRLAMPFVALLAAVASLLAGSAPVGAAAPGLSDVRVFLSGYGTVAVRGPGVSVDCTLDAFPCQVGSVPVGTTLTFTAAPAPIRLPEVGDPPFPD